MSDSSGVLQLLLKKLQEKFTGGAAPQPEPALTPDQEAAPWLVPQGGSEVVGVSPSGGPETLQQRGQRVDNAALGAGETGVPGGFAAAGPEGQLTGADEALIQALMLKKRNEAVATGTAPLAQMMSGTPGR
jgi:hypothetical protein